MKKLLILPILALAMSAAHAQNVYSTPNTACSGTPLVCTFVVQTDLVREVATVTLTFNASQSPASQNGHPFTTTVRYGPSEGSTMTFTGSPVIWGYQPGGFYVGALTLQFGSTQSTQAAVTIGFKQQTDSVLGTFWSVVARQDAVIGLDLTQAY